MIGRVNTGGGIKLPFRVIGGTTQPSNPKDGDIWVKTSVPIMRTEFANGTWASGGVGLVFLAGTLGGSNPTGTNSTVWAIKKNTGSSKYILKLTLTGCKQVQGSTGNWVNLDAYRYYGGTWVQFSSEFTATINITYPAGSTCTATDGTTTLTAPNTSGTWACAVPNAGTWTISLGNGFSETVSITTNGQTVTIDKWYLYNAGDQRTYITGGWEAQRYASIGNDRLVLNNTQSGTQIITKNKVDITSIKTIYAEIETKNGSGQRDLKFGVSDETGFEKYTAKKMVTQEGFNIGDTVTLAVDVSSLSGNYYIKLGSYNCGCDIPYVYCK